MLFNFLKDFREFISRGNIIDLAIGVIIGAAFGKIIHSLVDDIIMPPIGLLLEGINFKNLFFALDGHHYATLELAQKAGVATINYGNFITVIMEFLIIAASVFAMLKAISVLKREELHPLATPLSKSESLLTEIRDELKKTKE